MLHNSFIAFDFFIIFCIYIAHLKLFYGTHLKFWFLILLKSKCFNVPYVAIENILLFFNFVINTTAFILSKIAYYSFMLITRISDHLYICMYIIVQCIIRRMYVCIFQSIEITDKIKNVKKKKMNMKCKLLQARQIPIKFNDYKNQISKNCSRSHTYIYTHVNLLHNLR